MSENNDTDIWDKPFRADGLNESNNAFECFIKYRDMGVHRSLLKLSEMLNIDHQKLLNWSSKYKWNYRIECMLKNELAENKRLNAEIKKKELDRYNKLLETKGELVSAYFNVLKDNIDNYTGTDLSFKEFASHLNMASKIMNVSIDDLANIKEVENLFKDDSVDDKTINELVNNFNAVLSLKNKDAIDVYDKELKDDGF